MVLTLKKNFQCVPFCWEPFMSILGPISEYVSLFPGNCQSFLIKFFADTINITFIVSKLKFETQYFFTIFCTGLFVILLWSLTKIYSWVNLWLGHIWMFWSILEYVPQILENHLIFSYEFLCIIILFCKIKQQLWSQLKLIMVWWAHYCGKWSEI